MTIYMFHVLQVNYPMENGIVRNWEDMMHVWDYTFGSEKLNIDPKDSKILLTEPPMNPNKNREKMIEVSDIVNQQSKYNNTWVYIIGLGFGKPHCLWYNECTNGSFGQFIHVSQ